MSALPAKNRERIEPKESKEWMHACSVTFHTLISSFDPPDARTLESVREKDKDAVLRLPTRILSACFGVRVPLSLSGFEEVL
jgi:hypothetical protein